ncbi:MAG: hypothetical protein DHS20C16_29320 [Phycisphaerae bacterium]|nr:MAG: hypothetical protein DHS20C16_29320 [Phycisphaerae bacterium]
MHETDLHISKSLWLRFGKRTFDLFVSAILILLLSPLMLLTACAVKVTSRGPLLFRQERTGLRGKRFYPAKFRSMRTDHEHDTKEIVPLSHSGITPVGRFIRRFKIDELPQLFCVLAGEMSLIGPRPTIPEQTDKYNEFERRRLLVRPGATGLAQVNSPASQSWEERIKYDVYYVQHVNFWLDAKILLKTALVIVIGEERFTRPFDETPYAKVLADDDSQSN